MSARVLVVDDIPANVKVLEAKLTVEYFTVITAMSGAETLRLAESEAPDIILLDVMMPEMDGFETCRRLKANPVTSHIPVVMVTALSDVSDRVKGLEAGADDFLTKPVNDVILFARIRSLTRMKRAMDEWRMREQTCDQFGVMEGGAPDSISERPTGHILIVNPDDFTANRLCTVLEGEGHKVQCVRGGEEAMDATAASSFDLIICSLYLDQGDGLRLTSQLRATENCRMVPVLLVIEAEEIGGLVKGFELGINDYLIQPVDNNELKARTFTQLRQKLYRDGLQDNYHRSLSLALTDDLTGLHNLRYLSAHLDTALGRAAETRKPLSLLMIDIDHFKLVNDTYGHAVGDRVLKELAHRMTSNLREFDMAARLGGEEFVIIMPECPADIAEQVAERLRAIIADEPFDGGEQAGPLPITASIGVAVSEAGALGREELLAAADQALYAAKGGGRNRVVSPTTRAAPRKLAIGG